MVKKSRLGLYLEDEEIKTQVKIAAARRGLSTTAYCAQAIEQRLRIDGETSRDADRRVILSRVDRFRKEVGPVGITWVSRSKKARLSEQIGRPFGVNRPPFRTKSATP
jgi:hypothetical protein